MRILLTPPPTYHNHQTHTINFEVGDPAVRARGLMFWSGTNNYWIIIMSEVTLTSQKYVHLYIAGLFIPECDTLITTGRRPEIAISDVLLSSLVT
jgi:hypothetical protein